jgi:hypothetical protein
MKSLYLLLCMAVASTAQAKQCQGVEFPDHITIQGQELVLNGLGLRKATLFRVHVYVAALYVTRAGSDPRVFVQSSGPTELVLQFVRSVSANQLRDAWKEAFARTARDNLPALKDRIAALEAGTADVKSGQRMTFLRLPQGIQVSADGALRGAIPGDDFARAFLSIWLGDSPPNPELKAGLLGGPCE